MNKDYSKQIEEISVEDINDTCCSCGTQIFAEQPSNLIRSMYYIDFGNYCRTCNSLAGEMSKIRTTEYIVLDSTGKCGRLKCKDGRYKELLNDEEISRLCPTCTRTYSETEKNQMFIDAFLKNKRQDLVNREAHRLCKYLI